MNNVVYPSYAPLPQVFKWSQETRLRTSGFTRLLEVGRVLTACIMSPQTRGYSDVDDYFAVAICTNSTVTGHLQVHVQAHVPQEFSYCPTEEWQQDNLHRQWRQETMVWTVSIVRLHLQRATKHLDRLTTLLDRLQTAWLFLKPQIDSRTLCVVYCACVVMASYLHVHVQGIYKNLGEGV